MLCACVRGAAVLRWIRVHRRHGGTRWARPGCTRPPNASFRLRTRPAATRSTAPTPWRCRSGLPFGPRSLQFQFRFLHILRWLTATCPPNTHTHTSCARVFLLTFTLARCAVAVPPSRGCISASLLVHPFPIHSTAQNIGGAGSSVFAHVFVRE